MQPLLCFRITRQNRLYFEKKEVLVPGGLAVYGFDKNINRVFVSFNSDIIFIKEEVRFFITLGIAKDSFGTYYFQRLNSIDSTVLILLDRT